MKDHLSDYYALIILLGAALGSGFLSIPYSLQKFPLGSKFIFPHLFLKLRCC